jgi:hypothetical protein
VYDPDFAQQSTEILTRCLALLRRAPHQSAVRFNRETVGLSPDLLTNLRQYGSTPTPRQLQALKLHLSLTIGGVFKLFGYRLDQMRGVEARLNGGRTRFFGPRLAMRELITADHDCNQTCNFRNRTSEERLHSGEAGIEG